MTDGELSRDELLGEVRRYVIRRQQGATSMVARHFRIGFARAGWCMDELEKEGVVGPPRGSEPRDVLTTVEWVEVDQ